MADDRIATNSDLAEKEVALGDIDKESVPEAILTHGLDADEALKAFIGHEGESIVLDEATNKRLLRKIDLNIMPVRGSSSVKAKIRELMRSSLCALYTA